MIPFGQLFVVPFVMVAHVVIYLTLTGQPTYDQKLAVAVPGVVAGGASPFTSPQPAGGSPFTPAGDPGQAPAGFDPSGQPPMN
jgi:hypothetical protein